jgi:hypothetical protein
MDIAMQSNCRQGDEASLTFSPQQGKTMNAGEVKRITPSKAHQ